MFMKNFRPGYYSSKTLCWVLGSWIHYIDPKQIYLQLFILEDKKGEYDRSLYFLLKLLYGLARQNY